MDFYTSKKIALAGISSAMATFLLVVSVYVPMIDTTCKMLASLALLLSVSKNNHRCAVLAYLATSILGLILTGNIIHVLQFALFFGFHPILISILNQAQAPKMMKTIIKLIYANIALYIVYLIVGFTLDFLSFELTYLNFAIVASFVFLIYDNLIEKLIVIQSFYIDRYVFRKRNNRI